MERDAAPESKDSFVRWQAVLREQLSYAVNLFLTFATASLAYSLIPLRDKDFTPVGRAQCLFWFGVLSLLTSVLCGLVCVVSRLLDFRGTAQRARKKQELVAPGATWDWVGLLGKTTWFLFWTQFGSFALGAIGLGLSLFLTFGHRLL